MKRKKRNFYKKQIVVSKRKYPHRAEVNIEMDLGNHIENVNLTLPEEAEIEETLIPKEKENPNAFYIRTPPFTITFYSDTEKCFAYTVKGKFLGTLEKQDLKKLFSKIALILKAVKNRNLDILSNSRGESKGVG